MKKHNIFYIGAFLVLLTVSCKQDVITLEQPVTPTPETVTPTKGSADFTKFVAIGNSLTSGYQAGALFTDGQKNSFPAMMAAQFALVGGGAFNQPDINSKYGYNTTVSPNPSGTGTVYGRFLLQGTPAGPKPTISDVAAIPNPAINPSFMYAGDKTKLNNFSVPGILLGQGLIPDTGNPASPYFNPYWYRYASAPGVKSILQDALAANGTFYLFDLGNNDVLGYAASGALKAGDPGYVPMTATAGPTGFQASYTGAMAAILSLPNAKGVVGNIPNVTSIPFFFTVPWNPIPFTTSATDVATLAQLNGLAGYGGFNASLDGLAAAHAISQDEADKRKIHFATGANGFVIVDETLADLSGALGSINPALAALGQVRQTNSTDVVTLRAGSYLGVNLGTAASPVINGVSIPLMNTTSSATMALKGDDLVLIPSETTAILTQTAAFNAIIKAAVDNSGGRLALADVNSAFNTLVTNRVQVFNGVSISPSLAPPTGGFSEDAIHPNTRGYAFLANVYINAINSTFGATVPAVDLSLYSGTALPINP